MQVDITKSAGTLPSWLGGLSAIGSFLGGAGSLFSGLGFGSSGGVNKRMIREATTDAFQAKVRAARGEGIHPLYAIGAPSYSGPMGSGAGTDLQQIGSGLQDIAGAASTWKNRHRQAAKVQQADTLDDIHVKTAAVRLAQEEIQTRWMQDQYDASVQNRAAQTSTTMPSLFMPFFDNQTGQTTYLVNPEANMEPMEMIGTGYWGRARALSPSNYRQNPYQ